jgi:ribosomal protein S18 acetylase RimI-like enzyme
MPMIKCVCGEPMSGADDDALFASLRAHSDERHADLNISDHQLRDVIAARSRMSEWDGTRATLTSAPEIRPVTPERRDDWLRFFDRDAFMDNPMWADCYCMFYRFAGSNEAWERRTAGDNREEQAQAIGRGEVSGLLAYVDDKPVAWCHAAPRMQLPGLDRNDEFRTDEPKQVGSIVCFVVAAPYRGQGVAGRLLDAACEHLRARGMTIAEAYPPKDPASDARAYHGPLPMYLNSGFEVHREEKQYIVVRRTL